MRALSAPHPRSPPLLVPRGLLSASRSSPPSPPHVPPAKHRPRVMLHILAYTTHSSVCLQNNKRWTRDSRKRSISRTTDHWQPAGRGGPEVAALYVICLPLASLTLAAAAWHAASSLRDRRLGPPLPGTPPRHYETGVSGSASSRASRVGSACSCGISPGSPSAAALPPERKEAIRPTAPLESLEARPRLACGRGGANGCTPSLGRGACESPKPACPPPWGVGRTNRARAGRSRTLVGKRGRAPREPCLRGATVCNLAAWRGFRSCRGAPPP